MHNGMASREAMRSIAEGEVLDISSTCDTLRAKSDMLQRKIEALREARKAQDFVDISDTCDKLRAKLGLLQRKCEMEKARGNDEECRRLRTRSAKLKQQIHYIEEAKGDEDVTDVSDACARKEDVERHIRELEEDKQSAADDEIVDISETCEKLRERKKMLEQKIREFGDDQIYAEREAIAHRLHQLEEDRKSAHGDDVVDISETCDKLRRKLEVLQRKIREIEGANSGVSDGAVDISSTCDRLREKDAMLKRKIKALKKGNGESDGLSDTGSVVDISKTCDLLREKGDMLSRKIAELKRNDPNYDAVTEAVGFVSRKLDQGLTAFVDNKLS